MIYAGCDLGTAAAKAVIIQEGSIISLETLPYKNLPREAAIAVMEKALNNAGLRQNQIDYCIATGFGKKAVPYADDDSPEMICLCRAMSFLNPDIRTVIDAGGQSIRVFNISDKGRIIDSATNEKCAAGTGRFIEVMAKALELPLDQVSRLPLESRNPLSITSQCGVFAESEVITYVNDGKDRADIVAGICRSVAGKITSLLGRISLDREIVMVGGVAKISGVVGYVEESIGQRLASITIDPQTLGALGAALIAEEKHAGQAVSSG